MSSILDFTVLLTAVMAGLLGSGHCFGMCGGIAAGLGSTVRQGWASAVLFNSGRLMSYAILGAASATILSSVGHVLNVPQWGFVLRLMTAIMILLIGLQFVFGWQLLGGLERLGAKIWKKVLPFALRASAMPGGSGRLLLGLCWGLLPCGLVYSVLLTASSTGTQVGGALVMLAFGLGTLPSMLGMSLSAPVLRQFLADPWSRKLMGLALVFLAILSVILMLVHHPAVSPHTVHH